MPIPMEMSKELDTLASILTRPGGISNQVAHVLRRLIFSGTLRPGHRIVETRIARRLGIGQPTVREALVTLECEGLIVRVPNRGCVVTRLTEREYAQIFRVRVPLEALAVELAVQNRNSEKQRELQTILNKLKQAATEGKVENYYHFDFELHKAIWRLADNPYLERVLSQLVLPVFAFVQIEIFATGRIDLVANARQHEKLVQAILTPKRINAVGLSRQILGNFEDEGITLLREAKEMEKKGSAPKYRSTRKSRAEKFKPQ